MLHKTLIVCAVVFLLMFSYCMDAKAQQMMTLPNGQKIDASKLSNQEILDAIRISQKSIPEPAKNEMFDMVKGVNPESLDAWRKLLTGTIKDICNDLSITVNEFVKTPVGLGVAALIVYKVAGKDLLENALDVLILIPFWFIVTGINLYIGWYFFHCKTVYEYKDLGDGKIEKTNPKRVTAYAWEEDTDNKGNLAITQLLIQILVTFITLVMVLQ